MAIMKRSVEPELLDELPPDDPRAQRSRKDLQRVNAWMGNSKIMAAALRSAFDGQAPRAVVDLGAGDGTFLLRVARELAPAWNGARVLLLDQQDLLKPEAREAFVALRCRVESLQTEVLDWLSEPLRQPFDAIVANLFLHHFPDAQLAGLLRGVADRARVFVAVEPRRSAWSLAFARLVGLIGCNAVTRHDAVLSVKAGFAGPEVSRLWPAAGDWSLEERPAGRFSHLFIARRRT